MTELSVILPAHNEEDTVEDCINGLQRVLDERRYEIVIVEDGCEDLTREKAETIAAENKRVKHIHSDRRLGKGKAIIKGIEHSEGKIIGFMDSDMSIPCRELSRLLDNLSKSDDLIIGSRYMQDSQSNRNKYRLISSKLYNLFASKILGTGINDHQCGLKLFRRDLWNEISHNVNNDDWFWDTSLIYEAKKAGFKITEVGIKWEKSDDSSVNIIRDGALMVEKVVELKLNEKNIPIDVRYGRFALIGGLAALLNSGILYLLTDYFGVYYVLSSAIAIETAIVLMFFANNSFTFNNKKEGLELVNGLAKSNIVRILGVITNIGLLYAFTEFLNIYYLVSNILALFVASIINFIGEKKFTWEE